MCKPRLRTVAAPARVAVRHPQARRWGPPQPQRAATHTPLLRGRHRDVRQPGAAPPGRPEADVEEQTQAVSNLVPSEVRPRRPGRPPPSGRDGRWAAFGISGRARRLGYFIRTELVRGRGRMPPQSVLASSSHPAARCDLEGATPCSEALDACGARLDENAAGSTRCCLGRYHPNISGRPEAGSVRPAPPRLQSRR
ncbi:unnamed protein product [Prorocentrum cordatum]|uniref:Uncharacterized protein n=1 Tax=Prorocentrum cordatum TaxID=2364126 RepID=A0ABN9VFN0_9DINO|nr:unnamed protein product [Polarella glacialis]